MSSAWQALVIVLWGVVLMQTFLVLVLFRQVGIVLLGRGSARVRDGLPLSATAPDWAARDQWNNDVQSTRFSKSGVALLFADPDCGPCQHLVAELTANPSPLDDLPLVIIGSNNRSANDAMADRYELAVPVLTQLRQHLSRRFRVVATPFVYILDSEATVREKGIVNSLRQLQEKAEVLVEDGREVAFR